MPAKKLKPQPKQPKQSMADNDTISMDDFDLSDIVIDTSNYATTPSYTIGSGISSITNSITVPSTYTFSSGSYSSSWNNATVNITSDGIDLQQGSDIKVGGKSLTEAIEKIEERLGILHPNPELEEKWENLKGLRKAYMELEKELLEKEKMWKILKEK